MDYSSIVKTIIFVNERQVDFWSNSRGWTNEEASSLLEKSRLDLQVELAKSLINWSHLDDEKQGDLILAWVNLGALIESNLKLFMSVYNYDYVGDDKKIVRKGKTISVDVLQFEKIKIFLKEKDFNFIPYISEIQFLRNSIHAFKLRDIKKFSYFKESLFKYINFIEELDSRMPYPDEINIIDWCAIKNKFSNEIWT
jgi:hypothetical protein